MTAEELPTLWAMQLNLDEWVPFSALLSDAEYRACSLALQYAWRAEKQGWPRGHIPDEDATLARMIGRSSREAATVLPAMRRLFRPSPIHPGYLVCSWLYNSLESATKRVVANRTNGAKGGRRKRSEPIARPVGEPITKPIATPSTSSESALRTRGLPDRPTECVPHRRTNESEIEIGKPGTAESLQDSAKYPANADPTSYVYVPENVQPAAERAGPAHPRTAVNRPFSAYAPDMSREELARKAEEAKRMKRQAYTQGR